MNSNCKNNFAFPVLRCTLFPFIAFCMFTTSGLSQKILVLDTHSGFMFKRYRFTPGDKFCIKTNDGHHYRDTIRALGDSVVVLTKNTITLQDIRSVYIDRSNIVTRSFSKAFLLFGVGFPALDAFNNFINREQPLFKKPALIEGGAVTSGGLLLKMLQVRKYRLNKRNTLKTIDLSPA